MTEDAPPHGIDRRGGGTGPDAETIAAWFDEYRRECSREVRNRIVEAHLHLADYYVARFARSAGVASDDLRQTAMLAVIHAVERFDPSNGASFRTFASRTIEGELKRHLRDRTWSVRPPRRAQELHLQARRVSEELAHRFGRSPTVGELATEMGVAEEDVLEALEAGQARAATPLDAPGSTGTADSSLSRLLGAVDTGFSSLEERLVLRTALIGLDRREQLVLHLRFVEELSQPEIADEIGVSQSYVSRILRATLARLRADLTPSFPDGRA